MSTQRAWVKIRLTELALHPVESKANSLPILLTPLRAMFVEETCVWCSCNQVISTPNDSYFSTHIQFRFPYVTLLTNVTNDVSFPWECLYELSISVFWNCVNITQHSYIISSLSIITCLGICWQLYICRYIYVHLSMDGIDNIHLISIGSFGSSNSLK